MVTYDRILGGVGGVGLESAGFSVACSTVELCSFFCACFSCRLFRFPIDCGIVERKFEIGVKRAERISMRSDPAEGSIWGLGSVRSGLLKMIWLTAHHSGGEYGLSISTICFGRCPDMVVVAMIGNGIERQRSRRDNFLSVSG